MHDVHLGSLAQVVDDNGPASVGGARKGDLIFEINAVSVTGLTHGDVVKLIKAGGSTVNFKIVRGQPVRGTAWEMSHGLASRLHYRC